MKSLKYFIAAFILMSAFMLSSDALADDFYYTGGVQYNPYNGYTVVDLPPPPPMTQVPFYVRDDWDDYIEDYYKCILGYKHEGFVCRYWRKYAEKNGLYQRHIKNNAPVNNHGGEHNPPHNQGNMNNDRNDWDNSGVDGNNHNKGNSTDTVSAENSSENNSPEDISIVPYTPKH